MSASSPAIPVAVPRSTGYRWKICALLFFATLISYIDRGVIGYLEKYLEGVIGWNSIQYSYMTASFQTAYAIGLFCAGWLTDRMGTRRGFAIAIVLWSCAAMLPGAAFSALTFGIAMFFLGLGESANFPACIKTVAEWFPRKQRALATAIFNSGSSAGNIVVPLIVPVLTYRLGWRGAFVGTGALGFVWLAFWLRMYAKPEEHGSVSPQELAFIQSEREEHLERVPFSRILPCKETWAFSIGKFLTDAIWWFYLFWLPRYLQGVFHLNLKQSEIPVMAVYVISCIGGIAGGWLPSIMLRSGFSQNAARKTALLICALIVVPVIYAPFAAGLWTVVLLIGLATAGHQGFSANLFTLPSDVFPKSAVATVVGFGGMVGAAGGVLFQLVTGRVVHATNSYLPLFAVACSAYLVALFFIQLLAPKLTPALPATDH
jgi:ACS family hexuronate transporter-like MFS transporter